MLTLDTHDRDLRPYHMGFPCDQCDVCRFVHVIAGPLVPVGARRSIISPACEGQIHLEMHVEGEGSQGRSCCGRQCHSDSKDTACARLSLVPPKPAASLCPVMGAELHPT